MKYYFYAFIILISIGSKGQVGIGTTDPKSTLDVSTSINNTTTVSDGVTVPRISKNELALKAVGVYSSEQMSTLVYVNDVTGGTTGPSVSQVKEIIKEGFYHFNGTKWVSNQDHPTNLVQGVFREGVRMNPTQEFVPFGPYIKLGPGKWLVTTSLLLRGSKAMIETEGFYCWASFTYNDGLTLEEIATNTEYTQDFMNAFLNSVGFFSAPVPSATHGGKYLNFMYVILNGQLLINNTSDVEKYYGLMWYNSRFNIDEDSASNSNIYFVNLGSSTHGENLIYATKVELP